MFKIIDKTEGKAATAKDAAKAQDIRDNRQDLNTEYRDKLQSSPFKSPGFNKELGEKTELGNSEGFGSKAPSNFGASTGAPSAPVKPNNFNSSSLS